MSPTEAPLSALEQALVSALVRALVQELQGKEQQVPRPKSWLERETPGYGGTQPGTERSGTGGRDSEHTKNRPPTTRP